MPPPRNGFFLFPFLKTKNSRRKTVEPVTSVRVRGRKEGEGGGGVEKQRPLFLKSFLETSI
jgi:hypothetical protein